MPYLRPDGSPFIATGLEPYIGGSRNEPYRHGIRIEPYGQGVLMEPYKGGTTNEPYESAHGAASDALVAEALNLSTAAIVKLSDVALERFPWGAETPLSARADWVRANLAQAGLMERLRVAGGTLWLLPAFDAEGAPAGPAVKLLTLVGPGVERLQTETQLVINRKDERPDRRAEILVQSTKFWPFWTALTGLSATSAPRTFELLSIAAELSPATGQSLKQNIGCARPFQMSPLIQPLIETPGHASFPSGHATGAWLFVGVVSRLLDLGQDSVMRQQLERLAARIADNRVVAGVHYPMDSAAGQALGGTLAAYFVARCVGEGLDRGRVLDASGAIDIDTSAKASVPVTRSVVLAELWNAARRELGLSYTPLANPAAAA